MIDIKFLLLDRNTLNCLLVCKKSLGLVWKCFPQNVLINYIFNIYVLDIDIMVRVFANGPGDLGLVPGRIIPKTQKMVVDAALLNTQHYKVRIKGNVEQSRERSNVRPYTLV